MGSYSAVNYYIKAIILSQSQVVQWHLRHPLFSKVYHAQPAQLKKILSGRCIIAPNIPL